MFFTSFVVLKSRNSAYSAASCPLNAVSPMRNLSLFAAAFALAAGAFWSVILTTPPKSQAAAARPAQTSEIETADHCVTFGICP